MTPTVNVVSEVSVGLRSFQDDFRGIRAGGVLPRDLLCGKTAFLPAATSPASPPPVASHEDEEASSSSISSSSSSTAGAVSILTRGQRGSGLQWGEVRVGHVIGCGPMGEVRKAQNRAEKTLYAMKVVFLDKLTPTEPILQELSHLQALPSHTHLIRTYQAFAMYGGLQVVTEYVDVGSLQYVVDKVGPLSLDVLSCIFRQAVKGLGHLHEVCRLSHNDVKPSNILINSKGHVKLGDYAMPVVVTSANRGAGSFEYMSPERLSSDRCSQQGCGPKSDIWSLGVTVAQAALGVFPLVAEWPRDDLTNPFTQPTNAFLLAAMVVGGQAYVDFDRIMPKIRQFRSSRPVQALLTLSRLSPAEYDSNSIATDVRTFVSRCMAQSAPSRPSAAELLAHPLVTEHYKKVDLRAWLVSKGLAAAKKEKKADSTVPDSYPHSRV